MSLRSIDSGQMLFPTPFKHTHTLTYVHTCTYIHAAVLSCTLPILKFAATCIYLSLLERSPEINADMHTNTIIILLCFMYHIHVHDGKLLREKTIADW